MKVKITGGSCSLDGKEHGPGEIIDLPESAVRSLEKSSTTQFELVKAAPAPIAPPVPPVPPAPVVEKRDQVEAPKAKASGKSKAPPNKKKGAKSAKAKKGKAKKAKAKK